MDQARRYETQQKQDLTGPRTRPGSPTTTHRSMMQRAYNSSAERPFSRRNERSLWKPTSSLGLRRYPPFNSKPRLNQRSALKTQISHAEWRKVEKRKKEMADRQEVTKRRVQKKDIHRVSSPPSEKPAPPGPLTSQTIPSKEKDKRGRHKAERKADTKRKVKQPLSVSQATARSRAIRKKRKEIEEVYQQDCGTFCMVVQNLVSKDPSLASPIRFALQENLREIGLRCAAAMDQFITQYDLRDVCQ